jgi:uroporphyrinogen-III synthase
MTQPKIVTITVRQLPVLNTWKNRTMSEFDWRSPETYAKLQTAEAVDFAWECLRRNSRCREDYRTRQNSEAIAAIGEISRERWDSFMLSVNDVPATRDIFRRFAIESAAIRYAVAGGKGSDVTVIIVTGRSADPFPALPNLLSL